MFTDRPQEGIQRRGSAESNPGAYALPPKETGCDDGPSGHHRPVLFQDAIGPLADGVREDLPLRPLFIGGHLREQVHHAPRNPHRQPRIVRDALPRRQAGCCTSYPPSSLRHKSVSHLTVLSAISVALDMACPQFPIS
jgi:hypothetical protein